MKKEFHCYSIVEIDLFSEVECLLLTFTSVAIMVKLKLLSSSFQKNLDLPP